VFPQLVFLSPENIVEKDFPPLPDFKNVESFEVVRILVMISGMGIIQFFSEYPYFLPAP